MTVPPRVLITADARDLLRILRDRHGHLMLHQSGGCCDGSSPMCYPTGEFIVGDRDVLLGVLDLALDVGETPAALPAEADAVQVWISGPQFAAWRRTQLIVDMVPGRGGGFSLEAPEGLRFLTRSRTFTTHENAILDRMAPLAGADMEAGAIPPIPDHATVIGDDSGAGADCMVPK